MNPATLQGMIDGIKANDNDSDIEAQIQ